MENKAISSDLIRGHVDTIILHALLDGDKFPQQISDLVTKKSDGKYEINQATLYSSLKRLETLKYVQSYWHDTIGGRRKYYKLTELGKETVDANLSNWSYSRAIIDRLMDVEPETIVRTQYVDRVVHVEVPVEKPIPVQPASTPIVSSAQPTTSEKPQNSDEIVNNEPSAIRVSEPITYQREETDKEKNFRHILNGLIATTRKDVKPEIKPFNEAITNENTANSNNENVNSAVTEKKPLFSDTIDETHKYALKDVGKIDFGDLSMQVAKDGYKLRVSSKGPRIAKGLLYVNKVNMLSAIAVFILALLEFLIITFTCKTFINFSPAVVVLSIVALAIFPTIMIALYLKTPLKTIHKINADTILTAIIIVFNLILITFAISLLFSVDLSDIKNLSFAFIFPLLIYIDGFIYFVIRYFISKYGILKVKNEK